MPQRGRLTIAGLMGLVLVAAASLAFLQLLDPSVRLLLAVMLIFFVVFLLAWALFVFAVGSLIMWWTRSEEASGGESVDA